MKPTVVEPRSTGIWDRAQRHPVVLLAAVWAGCTLALFLFRPGYMFPLFGGFIDTWMYSSLQWDFRGQSALFGPNYFSSRLSALLPGMFFQHYLPADCAIVATKLLVSALLAFSMGATARAIGGLRAGLLAVLLSVLSPQVILFLGSDYVDTYVVLYGSLTLACIVMASQSPRWWAWGVLAGGSYAAIGVANISAYAMPGLGLGAFCLVQLRWFSWSTPRKLGSLLAFFIGSVAVYVILALLNRWLVGEFAFWRPQVASMLSLNRHANRWAPQGWQWILGATWLIVPIAAVLWGSYKSWIAVPADESLRRGLRALTLGLLVSLGATTAYGFHNDFGMFYQSFYASTHLCLALPGLALACAASFPDRMPTLRWAALTGLLLLSSILIYANPPAVIAFLQRHGLGFLGEAGRVPPFCAVVLLVVAAFHVWWNRRRLESVRPGPGPVLLLTGVMLTSVHIHYFGSHPSLRSNYLAVHDAFRAINAAFAPRAYLLWEDPHHPNSLGVASTKYWGASLFTGLPFPRFEPDNLGRLQGQTVIVPTVYGRGLAVVEEANRAFADYHLATSAERIIRIPGDDGAGFDLVCFSVRRATVDPERPPPGIPPPVLLFNLTTYSDPSYLQHMVYAVRSPPVGPIIDPTPSHPAFFHTDAKDHVATHFVTLPPNPVPGHDRQLAIVTILPVDGYVQCTIQDEKFLHLGHLRLTKRGREVHMATMPADSRQLRVVFESPRLPSAPLPTHILVYEISTP